MALPPKRCRPSNASTRLASSACAPAIMRAGISSRPISNNNSGMRLLRDHLGVGLGNTDGENPDAGNDADALSHRYGAPGVEQIEKVGALEAEVVSGQDGKAPRVLIFRLLRSHA